MRRLPCSARHDDIGPTQALTGVTVEFPAVSSAYDCLAFDEAIGEQAPVVGTDIGEHHDRSALQSRYGHGLTVFGRR
jgi:hypothetical protein